MHSSAELLVAETLRARSCTTYAVEVQKIPIVLANNHHVVCNKDDISLRKSITCSSENKPLLPPMDEAEASAMKGLVDPVDQESNTKITIVRDIGVSCVQIKGYVLKGNGTVRIDNPPRNGVLRMLLVQRKTGGTGECEAYLPAALCESDQMDHTVISVATPRGNKVASLPLVSTGNGEPIEVSFNLVLRPLIVNAIAESFKETAFPVEKLKHHYCILFMVTNPEMPLHNQIILKTPIESSKSKKRKKDETVERVFLRYLLEKCPEAAAFVAAIDNDSNAPPVPEL